MDSKSKLCAFCILWSTNGTCGANSEIWMIQTRQSLVTQWWTTVRSHYLVIWVFFLVQIRLVVNLLWQRISATVKREMKPLPSHQVFTTCDEALLPQPVGKAGAGQGLLLSVFINGPCRGEWRQDDLRNNDCDGVLSPSERASGTYIFMTCYLLEPARTYLFNDRAIWMLTKAELQHNYSAIITLTSPNIFHCNLHLHRGWV